MDKNKKHLLDLESKMKTKASSGKLLLFFEFICPHCGTVNVFSKEYKREIVLCSHRGCRRVIIIENYKDIA